MSAPDRDRDRQCAVGSDGGPTCSTGPLGRLIWTVRELADLLGIGRRRGPGDAR